MSISTANSSISYVGNDSTDTAYVVNYPFFDATDLKVFSVTGGTSTLLSPSAYTVTGGNGSTGTVTSTAGNAIPATSTVIISRSVPYTQLTSLTTGDRLPAATIEKALDKATMQAQQLSRNTLPDKTVTTGSSPYVLGLNTAGGTIGWVSQSAADIAPGAIDAEKLSTGHPNWDSSGNLSATSFVGPLTGDVTGNSSTATTATKLETARTLGVSGDVTGAASFDGSANATIAATIANGAVTSAKLGTNEQKQIAKAWGGATSAGVINALTYGVSTITRSGLGNYLVTMPTAINGYSVVGSADSTVGFTVSSELLSTTQFRIRTFGGGGSAADAGFRFAVFGV